MNIYFSFYNLTISTMCNDNNTNAKSESDSKSKFLPLGMLFVCCLLFLFIDWDNERYSTDPSPNKNKKNWRCFCIMKGLSLLTNISEFVLDNRKVSVHCLLMRTSNIQSWLGCFDSSFYRWRPTEVLNLLLWLRLSNPLNICFWHFQVRYLTRFDFIFALPFFFF